MVSKIFLPKRGKHCVLIKRSSKTSRYVTLTFPSLRKIFDSSEVIVEILQGWEDFYRKETYRNDTTHKNKT